MSNSNILNLDDLTSDEKVLIIGGIQHTAVELTVEAYIARVKRAKSMKAKADEATATAFATGVAAETDGNDVTERVEEFVVFINEMFPSIPVETLRGLSLVKLNALIEFAMRAPDDIAAAAAAAAKVPVTEPTNEVPVGNV